MDRDVHEHEIRPGPGQAADRRLATMGAAVVHHPEHPAGRRVGLGCHHLVDQACEGNDASRLLASAEHLGAMHVPGRQVLQGSAAFVFELDAR